MFRDIVQDVERREFEELGVSVWPKLTSCTRRSLSSSVSGWGVRAGGVYSQVIDSGTDSGGVSGSLDDEATGCDGAGSASGAGLFAGYGAASAARDARAERVVDFLGAIGVLTMWMSWWMVCFDVVVGGFVYPVRNASYNMNANNH